MQQPYVKVAQLLDDMTTINKVWYTPWKSSLPLMLKLTKERMEMDKEMD